MTLSNKTYDLLNDIVKIGLPALATLYAALAGFWGFPNPVEVVGTVTAVATAGGVWIKVLSRKWQDNPDGTVSIDVSNPAAAEVRLELTDTDVFAHKDGDLINMKVHTNAAYVHQTGKDDVYE